MFHCSVDEMLGRVTSLELAEWNAYYLLRAEDEAEQAEQAN